jgi:hypothetical protein
VDIITTGGSGITTIDAGERPVIFSRKAIHPA